MSLSTKQDSGKNTINNYCSWGNVHSTMSMMGQGTPDEHNTVELESNFPYQEIVHNKNSDAYKNWENGIRPVSKMAPLVPI